jgi:hypothetical protein
MRVPFGVRLRASERRTERLVVITAAGRPRFVWDGYGGFASPDHPGTKPERCR